VGDPVPEPVVLDGSHGEGGGQIVRTALLLSVLTQKKVVVEHIRAGRAQPGLKGQHVSLVEALEKACGAKAQGATLGSSRIAFKPGAPQGGHHRIDIGTAGSIPLMLQSLIPIALAAPSPLRFELRGGTDVPFAPTMDWTANVFAHALGPLAKTIEIDCRRRGFYPKGGGVVDLHVEPRAGFSDLSTWPTRVHSASPGSEPGPTQRVALRCRSVAEQSLAAAHVAERQAKSQRSHAVREALPPMEAEIEYVAADNSGTALTFWLEGSGGARMGACAVGRRGVRAETVASDAWSRLVEDHRSGAAIDRHLADHLVPLVAFGYGRWRVPPATSHLETNIEVCNRFFGGDVVRLVDGLLERP
jgi:RNA 3'-phosphate cyclase